MKRALTYQQHVIKTIRQHSGYYFKKHRNNKRYINRATAAKALGINSNTVKSRISAGKSLDEAFNNPIIPAGEQVRLPIKEDYFKNIDTKDKAYFLGLMLTDGWIQQGGQLKVEKNKNRLFCPRIAKIGQNMPI